MVLPFVWPRDDYPDDLPSDIPNAFKNKGADLVRQLDVDQAMVDAIDRGTADVTWTLTLRWEADDLTDRERHDVWKTAEKIANYEAVNVILVEKNGTYVVRFDYSP